MNVLKQMKIFITKYPLARGIVSYTLIWPTSSMIQQTMEGRRNYDWLRVLRFSIYGGFFVAPTLYAWIKLSSAMYPQFTLRSAVSKAVIETVSYTPAAMTCFYFIMSLLEGKSIQDSGAEVGKKFLPTYKVAVCVWPLVATINFSLIREKNRVPFISVCSFLWSIFLAYMKHIEDHPTSELGIFNIT